WMESLLQCLAGSGLRDVDRLAVVNLLGGYIHGHFRLYDDLTKGARARGLTREQAERDYFVTIGRVLDTERFPGAAAAFDAVRAAPATDARQDFEFGLMRILDGVEVLSRRSEEHTSELQSREK